MRQRRTARRSTANNYILIVFDSCRFDSRSLRHSAPEWMEGEPVFA